MLNRQTEASLEDFEAWAKQCGHYQILEGLERYYRLKGRNKQEEARPARVNGAGTG